MLKCTHVQGEKRKGTQWQILQTNRSPGFPATRMGKGYQEPEFKILAWEQKKQGRRMKDIFRDNGIDPDILGRKRIENFSVRLDDAVREGRFLPDRRIYNSRPAGAADPEQMPLEERVRWLIHELEYAKQEVEFLKKLQMANTEARKEWESKHRHG